jgi:hypothetical protein
VNQTLIDNLRYVLQNMRLQPGDMAKVQADIVAQAIIEIDLMGCRIEELQNKIAGLEKSLHLALHPMEDER